MNAADPWLESAAWFQPLRLKCEILVSTFAFKWVHLCRYTEAVTITSEDLLRLKPNEFLNDRVIDLMMKRLQQDIAGKPGAKRFHFFSSLFYQKLCESPVDTPVAVGLCAS